MPSAYHIVCTFFPSFHLLDRFQNQWSYICFCNTSLRNMLDGDIAIIWSRSFKEVGPVSCKLHNPPPLVIFFGANLCPTKKFKVTTLNPTVIVLIEAQAPFVGPVAPFYKELFIITQRDPEGTNHEFQ